MKAADIVWSKKRSLSQIIVIIFLFGFFIYLITPFLMIALTSFGKGWFGARWFPESFTLKWFTLGLRTVDVFEYMLNTIIIGIIAAFFSLLVGMPAAWVISQRGFKYRSLLLVLFLTPRMVPPLSYAIGLAKLFYSVRLIDTHIGVALSHLAICVPYVVLILATSFDGIDKRLLDAGRVLGAHGLKFAAKVVVPLVLPGIISSGVFAFVTSYNEFTMTIMTYGPHTITMPIMTYSIIGEGYWEFGAAISMIILVPSLVFLFWIINQIKPEQLLGGLKGT